MSVWGWILIAAIVVILAVTVVAVRLALTRRRSERLREKFGPEYERTLSDAGDQRAAEADLAAREQKRKKLDIVPLSLESGEKYAERWRTVQIAFVDNPSSAVGDADRLVIEVMRERGYPVEDFDQRAADISVDHPDVVENYRAAHRIHLAQREREISTEEQRQALVHYRALFDKLLETEQGHTADEGKDNSQEARA
ncbi:MAG TPA: hypothetical protein VF328_05385 [Mycobacterium sp.]